jgi:hypothetical protein
LRHRRETKAFPRLEHRSGLVAHAPAYATPMRGRATISISPPSSGSARDSSSPGRSRPVVTGEFCRTPKINYDQDQDSGVMQPGRDHSPRAVWLMFSGGGLAGGHVIGATDRLGADVTRRRVGIRDFLATIYDHMGIDAASMTLRDRTCRPIPALPEGRAIPELIA